VPQDRSEPAADPLEAALLGLTPRPPALDRDAVLFRAGRESARAGLGWPVATAAASLAALALGVVLLTRPVPAPEVRVVYLPALAPAPDTLPEVAPPLPPNRPTGESVLSPYARLQDEVYRKGLDGVPPMPPAPEPAPPVTVDGLLTAP
jgi:hypothetical protein